MQVTLTEHQARLLFAYLDAAGTRGDILQRDAIHVKAVMRAIRAAINQPHRENRNDRSY
jgi:hypothetical protein